MGFWSVRPERSALFLVAHGPVAQAHKNGVPQHRKPTHHNMDVFFNTPMIMESPRWASPYVCRSVLSPTQIYEALYERELAEQRHLAKVQQARRRQQLRQQQQARELEAILEHMAWEAEAKAREEQRRRDRARVLAAKQSQPMLVRIGNMVLRVEQVIEDETAAKETPIQRKHKKTHKHKAHPKLALNGAPEKSVSTEELNVKKPIDKTSSPQPASPETKRIAEAELNDPIDAFVKALRTAAQAIDMDDHLPVENDEKPEDEEANAFTFNEEAVESANEADTESDAASEISSETAPAMAKAASVPADAADIGSTTATNATLLFARDFPPSTYGQTVRKQVSPHDIGVEASAANGGTIKITGLWSEEAPRVPSPRSPRVRDVDEDGNEVILPQDTDSEPETEKPKFSETVEIPLPSLKKLTNVRAELDDNGFRLWLDQ